MWSVERIDLSHFFLWGNKMFVFAEKVANTKTLFEYGKIKEYKASTIEGQI